MSPVLWWTLSACVSGRQFGVSGFPFWGIFCCLVCPFIFLWSFSSSGVASRHLPCLSLLLVSLFPRPFLPFLRLASLFFLRDSLGLLLSSLCFLALPWLLLSPPSLLSPLLVPQVTSLSHLVSNLLAPVISSSLCVGSSPFPVVSSSLSFISSSLGSFVASSLVPGVASASSAGVASCSFLTGSSWSLLSVVVYSTLSAPHFLLLLLFCRHFWLLALLFLLCSNL